MQQRLVQENALLGGKRPIFLAKDPPIARYPSGMSAVLPHLEITPQRPNLLAEDAVRCQPVSSIEFPGNREINREFCEFGPFLAILAPNRGTNSMDCSKIPYAPEQGIF